MFIRNGEEFDIHAFQVLGEIQYPVGWFYDEGNRAAFDISEIATPVPPAVTSSQVAIRTGFQQVNGVWQAVWQVRDKTEDELAADVAALAVAKAVFVGVTVDAEADAILERVIGARATEYLEAEAEAKAYKDAGYNGTVPDGLQDWATIKGWTAHAAADNILETAAAWRQAQKAIRKARLTAKEAGRVASTPAQLEAARSAWAGFQAYIRAQLGI